MKDRNSKVAERNMASSPNNLSSHEEEIIPPALREIRKKALRIKEVLDFYYPDPPIPLNHSNDFTFLVAVVLSAQTTDGKVNEVTKELFHLADNPSSMAKLSVEEVERIIRPVGLAPRKAKSIVGLSQILIDKFDGKVPNTYEALESLPGVGHKTASVIMSQLFGVPSFAVDTHVHRLSLRWGLTKHETNPDCVQKDLCNAFPSSCWDKAHLQMIYFGREYCVAKNHSVSQCPICSWINRPSSKDDVASRPGPLSSSSPSFSPHKKSKGLVYYADRINELSLEPSLAVFSNPSPVRLKVEENMATPSLSCNISSILVSSSDICEDKIESSIISDSTVARKSMKRKRVSGNVSSHVQITTRSKYRQNIILTK